MEGPKENRQQVLDQKGWQDWFLDLLLDSSPIMQQHASAVFRNASSASTATPATSWDVRSTLDLLHEGSVDPPAQGEAFGR